MRHAPPVRQGIDRLGGWAGASSTPTVVSKAAQPVAGGRRLRVRMSAEGVVQHADCVLEGSDFGPTEPLPHVVRAVMNIGTSSR